MGYGLNDSYFSPTKQQLQKAIIKVEKAVALSKTISFRLNREKVTVRKWWGFGKKTKTQHEHIIEVQGNNIFNGYSNIAYKLGYITWEERAVFQYLFDCPTINTLREWAAAEKVFLCEGDYKDLIYALEEEP